MLTSETLCLKIAEGKYTRPDFSDEVKLRKLLNDTFKEGAKLFDNIRGLSLSYGLRGNTSKLRKAAIISSMDRVRAESGKLRLRAPELSFAEFEALSLYNYADIEDMFYLSTAAALWVLDQLKCNGNLREACRLMISDTDEIYSEHAPDVFLHPGYEYELILSAQHLLTHRTGSKEFVSYASAEPSTETFRKLTELIGQDRIDQACRTFENLQWDIIRRAMKVDAFFIEEEDSIIRDIKRVKNPSALMTSKPEKDPKDEVFDLVESLRDLQTRKRWVLHKMDHHLTMPRKELVKSLGNRYGADIFKDFRIDDPFELCAAVFFMFDRGSDNVWLLKSATTLLQCAAMLLPWYEPEYPDKASDFFIYDDAGFINENVFNRNDWMNQAVAPEAFDLYHSYIGALTPAQILYRVSGGLMPYGIHPFSQERALLLENGADPCLADRIISLCEVFFMRDFQSYAYNLMHDDWFADASVPEESAADASDPAHSSASAQNDNSAHAADSVFCPDGSLASDTGSKVEDEPTYEDLQMQLREAQSELARAKTSLKSLRKSLSEISRGFNFDKAKYEKELRELRKEHRELADLRDLVFNSDQDSDVEDVKHKKGKFPDDISFPYNTRKRIVVFGGHDRFLKSIRPMLPDVKFIDVDKYNFNPEIIRGADVVWVQSNHISHSQYWRILDITRRYGIQLRYFSSSGAENCAIQIALDDKEQH